MKLKLKPWTAPNFAQVVIEKGYSGEKRDPVVSVSLKAMDSKELSDQCDRFRVDVFRKAGKADPALSVRR